MRRNVFVLSHNESARDDILSILCVMRQLGRKTMDGLGEIAKHAGLLPRRTKTIVMQDQPCVVTEEQRRHLALAIADLFDKLGDEFEQRAEACREKGDAIRYRERQQLTLELGGGRSWKGSGTRWKPSGVTPKGLAA